MMGPAYVPPHRRQNHSLRTPQHNKAHPPILKQDFDSQSGQVYHEYEVGFKKKQSFDWIGELKTASIAKRPRPSKLGSRSLLEMARTKCIGELRSFTPQHFETVPWSLASTIWDEIVSNHLESFHAWRTLASTFNQRDEFGQPENRYHMEIKQPPLPIQEYLHGISSASNLWLSVLRISPKQLTIPELMAIANVTNLSVLDLSDGQLLFDTNVSPFNERIMRAWAELASSGRAFQRLQVLMLGWQESVSDWIFKYLDRFRSLRYIITTDCKSLHQKNRSDWEESATSYGWVALHAKRSVKTLRPLLDDKTFHSHAVSKLCYHAQEQAGTNSCLEMLANDRKPVLECWLGTPHPWTHILEDFPGTRTIWFEKTSSSSQLRPDGTAPDANVADQTKRSWEVASTSTMLQLLPRKRTQGVRDARFKAPTRNVGNILADMGV